MFKVPIFSHFQYYSVWKTDESNVLNPFSRPINSAQVSVLSDYIPGNKNFFFSLSHFSFLWVMRARSLSYSRAMSEENVIFRMVDEWKRSMENSKEIKWWTITSIKLIRCIWCTGEDSIPGRSLGMRIPSVLIFSAARELFSNPSTLIDNQVERADLDRTTDEDFLPRGTGFCGGSLCNGERNNFYLRLKNILQDIASSARYIIHYISSHKDWVEKYLIWTRARANPQIT